MISDRRQAARDRRRERRAPLVAAVAAKRVRGRAHLAQSANIGARGIELRYAAGGSVLLPRTVVALAFQLPGADAVIRLRGEVVFDRPAEDGTGHRTAGVRFERVSPRDATEIERFLDDAGAS